ncbi:hypothetical protein [Ramu stunt virus]|uniref:Uncharacterized protein n=1 Tax=Ramu stunt virus TaxID=1738604 RepID=A0A0P0HVL5_9VIRU|nr:hypothetical protein [Ramu stunt virus]
MNSLVRISKKQPLIPIRGSSSVTVDDVIHVSFDKNPGKPTEYVTHTLKSQWRSHAKSEEKIVELDGPTINRYFRIRFAVLRFSPLIPQDCGRGKIILINKALEANSAAKNPIFEIEYGCNEHFMVIFGSNQWLECTKKISVFNQTVDSISKPGEVINDIDVHIVYECVAKTYNVVPIPMEKINMAKVEDSLNDLMGSEKVTL